MNSLGRKLARDGRLRAQQLASSLRIATSRRTGRLAVVDAPRPGSSQLLVSLTSYPARIDSVAQTIESLLAQRHAPDAVVLVLAEPEFPGRRLPAGLVALRRHGVDLLWVADNSRSYKKLLPVLSRYPDATIVTVDDDVLYPRWWLQRMVAAHWRHPDSILGYRGVAIQGAETAAQPYVGWPAATSDTPPDRVLLTGVGGILYPPGSLSPRVTDLALAQELCPTADDIWFRAMALLQGTPVRLVLGASEEFPTVWQARQLGLAATNVGLGANDRQLAAVCDHFGLWAQVFPVTGRPRSASPR